MGKLMTGSRFQGSVENNMEVQAVFHQVGNLKYNKSTSFPSPMLSYRKPFKLEDANEERI